MRLDDKDLSYTIHLRKYRETSRLLTVLTKDHGKLSLVIRISKKNTHRYAALIQPFNENEISWRGRSELKTLTDINSISSFNINAEQHLIGLYCNELIQKLVPANIAYPAIFNAYKQVLNTLTEPFGLLTQSALRWFEFCLLDELGYALDFDYAAELLLNNELNHVYFNPEYGFLIESSSPDDMMLDATVINAVLSNTIEDIDTLKILKRLNNVYLDKLLDGKLLHSRDLFKQLKRAKT